MALARRFETGTELNDDGIPVDNARALPDGEIKAGTPTPRYCRCRLRWRRCPRIPCQSGVGRSHPRHLGKIDGGGPNPHHHGRNFYSRGKPSRFQQKADYGQSQEIPEDGTKSKYTRWNIMRNVGIRALRRKETQPISFLMDCGRRALPPIRVSTPTRNVRGVLPQSGGVSASSSNRE